MSFDGLLSFILSFFAIAYAHSSCNRVDRRCASAKMRFAMGHVKMREDGTRCLATTPTHVATLNNNTNGRVFFPEHYVILYTGYYIIGSSRILTYNCLDVVYNLCFGPLPLNTFFSQLLCVV